MEMVLRQIKEMQANWTHAACASIKMLSHYDCNQKAIEHNITSYVFDNSGLGFGCASLIKWKDLFKNDSSFVKDDSIDLEIKIEAEDSNTTNRSALKFESIDRSSEEGCVASFRLIVNNIESLIERRCDRHKSYL